MELQGLLLSLAVIAGVLLYDRKRKRDREADRDRWRAMTPAEQARTLKLQQEARILAEATPGERPEILERFAFLDSIEHLGGDEKLVAYGEWQDARTRPTVESKVPPLPAPPKSTAPKPAPPEARTKPVTARPLPERAVVRERAFVAALESEMPTLLKRLHEVHAEPTDFVRAAVDAGLAIFVRYPRLVDDNGSVVPESTARGLIVGVLLDNLVDAEKGVRAELGVDDTLPSTQLQVVSYNQPGRRNAEFGMELAASILSERDDRAFLDRLSSWSDRPWGTPWGADDEIITTAAAVTEIGFKFTPGLTHHGPYGVALRRGQPAIREDEYSVDTEGAYEADFDAALFDDLARGVALLRIGPAARREAVREKRRPLDGLLESLPELEREVIRLRVGLDDGTTRSIAEIERDLGLSARRIRDIEKKANRAFRVSGVLDASTKRVWLLHGDQQISVDRAVGRRVAQLVEGAASTLRWRATNAAALAAAPPGDVVFSDERGDETCQKCGAGTIIRNSGRFGPYRGCSRYLVCDYIKHDGPPPPDPLPFEVICPKHGDGTLVPRRARRTGNVFYGCSNYPRCDFTTNLEPLGGAHDTDDGPLARWGEAAICLVCGSASDTSPDDIAPGERYAGGQADPSALARPRQTQGVDATIVIDR